MLGQGTLVPNYLRSFSCKGTFFPSIIVRALKIGSFLFVGGTIVPINSSGLNEMEQFVPNHEFLFMKNGSY